MNQICFLLTSFKRLMGPIVNIKGVLCILLLSMVYLFAEGQNIALHMPYTLSVKPNYSYTAPPYDTISLTDGIFTNGYFWRSMSTVGWNKQSRIKITIDLGRVQPINSVTFNTVKRGSVRVYFPKAIFIFIGDTDRNYRYAGNMVDKDAWLDTSLAYKVKKLSLDNINQAGRYVSLVVIPNGSNVFCDEIGVMKGGTSFKNRAKNFHYNRIDRVVDSLMWSMYQEINLESQLKEFVKVGEEQDGLDSVTVSRILLSLNEKDRSEAVTQKVLIDTLFQQHAVRLQNKFGRPFVINKVNPWTTVSSPYIPEESTTDIGYSFSLPEGDTQYGGFMVTNLTQYNEHFSFRIEGSHDYSRLDLFSVHFVPTEGYTEVKDPLLPVHADIDIASGRSELFVFKVSGNIAGQSMQKIKVRSLGREDSIVVESKVVALTNIAQTNLDAVNWAYLNLPMIDDRNEEVAYDLQVHHINTIVVPPPYIPKMGSDSYQKYLNYIKYFPYARNIILNISLNRPQYINPNYRQIVYLSNSWKKMFVNWYKKIMDISNKAGIEADIYLFPYDEVHGAKDISDFKEFILWAKAALPGCKIYATLANPDAVRVLAPILDISQLNQKFDLSKYLSSSHGKIWTYYTKDTSRLLSPYSYYRLMSWKAFYDGLSGIGFWVYCTPLAQNTILPDSSNFAMPYRDFSVIYVGRGKSIISSRRWEAFKLGIEDYAIIKRFANKFGQHKAEEMVKKVIESPTDFSLADSIRSEMLNSLQ